MKLGEKQKLYVVKQVDFGVYLAESMEDEKAKGQGRQTVLLPLKQVPEGTKVGDQIEVFLYLDSEDRLIATTKEPGLMMGYVSRLKVKQVNRVGAFLDWGLDKDLFLPFRQQTVKVEEGDSVLASLYIDKSGRLCATMNVYESLKSQSPYRKDSTVTGTIYQISDNFGAFVAVDDYYSALIPKKEILGSAEKLAINTSVTARVARVLPDGRLELAVRDKGYLQREKDSDEILRLIREHGGKLPFSDKASPELISQETGMSKAQFKRAVGKLLKENFIEIGENCIIETE